MNPIGVPWIVVALGAAALVVAVVALRGDRARGRRRCPRCWYDMGGAKGGSLRCPECGHVARDDRDLLRARRRWVVGGPALLVAVACLAWSGMRVAVARGWHYLLLPKWRTTASFDVALGTGSPGAGTLRIEEREVRNPAAADFARMLVVSRDGRDLFALEGFYFTVGAPIFAGRTADGAGAGSPPLNPTISIGADITGDGVPDLVLQRHSGGSGGDMQTYVFSLDRNARFGGLDLVDVIPYSGRFEDVDGDGRPEFIAGDRALAYRWTSGAASPRPEVVLTFRNGRYRVDLDRLRRPAPPMAELVAALDAVSAESAAREAERAGKDGGAAANQGNDRTVAGTTRERPMFVGERATALLRLVADLVYSGNAARAKELLDAEWPRVGAEFAETRAEFDGAFGEALSHSPFAAELRELNGPAAWWPDAPHPVPPATR
ncbi:MAG: hypothetical protein U0575_15865 [Phycisphaerales bacterium]